MADSDLITTWEAAQILCLSVSALNMRRSRDAEARPRPVTVEGRVFYRREEVEEVVRVERWLRGAEA